MPYTGDMSPVQHAAQELAKRDPILAPIIARLPCTITPHTQYYRELVESIIGQQLSVKAAETITQRFVALFGDTFPSPQQIVAASSESMRAAGLSNAKVAYVRDLAQHIIDGELNVEALPTLSNEAAIKTLVAVKGIGEWTAHMFLIFALARLDVLPVGDLGFKTGLMRLYGFDALPTPAQVTKLAADRHWHPYESIATWYVWQSLDNAPLERTRHQAGVEEK